MKKKKIKKKQKKGGKFFWEKRSTFDLLVVGERKAFICALARNLINHINHLYYNSRVT